MKPSLNRAGLKDTRAWEHAVRFVFGGLISAGIGLISHKWGPTIGGLFLGFPAIFPASITMVKKHDGRARAVDDSRGAALGATGLVSFALVVVATARRWSPTAVLTAATLSWAAVGLAAWMLVYGWRRRQGSSSPLSSGQGGPRTKP